MVEEDPDEDEVPGRRNQVDRVPCGGERDEQRQRPSRAEPVSNPPAGILIETVQQVADGAVEADREHRRAQHVEIFREKALPELFAEPHQEHRAGDGDNVAPEPQELGDAEAAVGDRQTLFSTCGDGRGARASLPMVPLQDRGAQERRDSVSGLPDHRRPNWWR
jgi:hypothetical protein